MSTKEGESEVQAFVGSLVGKGAGKGVMLTTSRFTDDARQFVKHLQQKVVLIDGEELTGLMIDFNVVVAATTQYVVKKIDLDYFGEEGTDRIKRLKERARLMAGSLFVTTFNPPARRLMKCSDCTETSG